MDEAKRILRMARDRGEFIKMECGYYHYWPSKIYNGAMSASVLRILADELDAMNKDWDEQVKKDTGRAGE